MREPYYTDDSCTIYHADCRDVLDAITYDSVVTDPPYGINAATRLAQGSMLTPDHEQGVLI